MKKKRIERIKEENKDKHTDESGLSKEAIAKITKTFKEKQPKWIKESNLLGGLDNIDYYYGPETNWCGVPKDVITGKYKNNYWPVYD